MDFIREINAFEQWLRVNYLAPISQLMWYKLFTRCNSAGWPEWFTVENLDFMASVKLKNEKTFIGYRDKLIETGLVQYRRGKKNSPNQYKMISIVELLTVKNTTNSTTNSTINSTVNSTINPTDLSKPKTENINPPLPPKGERQVSGFLNREQAIACIENLTPDKELQQAAIDWLDMRLANKKKLTERALILTFNKLHRLASSAEEAVQIFEQSTINGWTGVFPVKGGAGR